MLLWSADVFVKRSPASRFTQEQIGTMTAMARAGASSIEIGKALDLKPAAIRAKLNSLGIRLRRRVARLRLRLVVPVTKAMQTAAERRGITCQALIRRLLTAISKNDLFDSILPIPAAHSLGAAAVVERWHNQPTILRRIELAGCVAQPQIDVVLPRAVH